MKAVVIASTAFIALLTAVVPTALGQRPAQTQAATIVCPATIAVGATPGQDIQGWSSVANSNATVKGAQVINAVGLAPPTLVCTYTLAGQALEIARLTRPEPTGVLCTVNATKGAQFDCFPRPGAGATPPTYQH